MAGRNARQHPLEHHLLQLIAIGEMLVRPERHLRLAVSGPDPRPLHRHPPAAERHLAVLVAVADRDPVPVPLAPRTRDLLDLMLQQLAEHTEPNLNRQRE
jgi:hypothetical protein